uniref:Uncharacterized protein n=1 Tax=Arundo donax TaxID=35708 RepID=A0A0A9AT43_ARUDO
MQLNQSGSLLYSTQGRRTRRY